MHIRYLDKGELIAIVGGIILGVSLFLPWYSLSNAHATLNVCKGPDGTCSGWHAVLWLRYILLIAAVAPLFLLYVVLRNHALGWPRGEMSAVIAMTALVFTIFRGVLDKPGTPRGEIATSYGWWVAILGGLVILAGSVFRSQEGSQRSKPPGTL